MQIVDMVVPVKYERSITINKGTDALGKMKWFLPRTRHSLEWNWFLALSLKQWFTTN